MEKDVSTKIEACITYTVKQNTMQVKTLQGIPFLVDPATKNIYAYEKNPSPAAASTPLHLGTYDPTTETYTLRPDWENAYKERVDAYRASEKPRSRIIQTQQPAK